MHAYPRNSPEAAGRVLASGSLFQVIASFVVAVLAAPQGGGPGSTSLRST